MVKKWMTEIHLNSSTVYIMLDIMYNIMDYRPHNYLKIPFLLKKTRNGEYGF